MDLGDVDIEEFTRNFRLSYSKAGLMIYVVPRNDVEPLMARGEPINGEYVTPYGTRVLIHVPCGGMIYGRYLARLYDWLWGIYVITAGGECVIDIEWREQGVRTSIGLRHGEALLMAVRLLGPGRRRRRPTSEALRIMRILGILGRLLYSTVDGEVQVFGIVKGPNIGASGDCISEVSVGDWRFMVGGCGSVVMDSVDNTRFLMIGGADEVVIARYYPSLSRWYVLGRVGGFGRYLVVVKG